MTDARFREEIEKIERRGIEGESDNSPSLSSIFFVRKGDVEKERKKERKKKEKFERIGFYFYKLVSVRAKFSRNDTAKPVQSFQGISQLISNSFEREDGNSSTFSSTIVNCTDHEANRG